MSGVSKIIINEKSNEHWQQLMGQFNIQTYSSQIAAQMTSIRLDPATL